MLATHTCTWKSSKF